MDEAQAAKSIGITPRQLANARRAGRVEYVKGVGHAKYRAAMLETLIEESTCRAKPKAPASSRSKEKAKVFS